MRGTFSQRHDAVSRAHEVLREGASEVWVTHREDPTGERTVHLTRS